MTRQLRRAATLSTALGVLLAVVGVSTPAHAADNRTYEQILRDERQWRPGGKIVGRTIEYSDGTVFTAVRFNAVSTSQCKSPRMCGWQNANFRGSFYSLRAPGALTRTLTWRAKSYWNNRTKAARLYNSNASGSTCIKMKTKRPSVSSSYHRPQKVKLSGTASC